VLFVWFVSRPQEELYSELAAIASSSLRFATKVAPFHDCPHLASDMHKYAPERIITGGRLFWSFDADGIRAIVDRCVA
jgi:hypothetical protein